MIRKVGSGIAAVLVLLAVSTTADAADRRVRILNKTDTALEEFYASNVGTNDWEEDILGQDVLGANESINVNIDDGSGYCKFDFRGVFEDGEEVVKRNVDVCATSTFTFSQ